MNLDCAEFNLIPPKEVIISTDLLGSGGSAKVWAGVWTPLGGKSKQVAVKSLPCGLPEQSLKPIINELKVLNQASKNCTGVCRFFGVTWKESSLHIIMQRYDGSLLDKLHEKGKMTTSDAIGTAVQVISSLAELHQQRIVVRDLKPANILFDRLGRYAVSDFGISVVIETTISKYRPTTAGIGTPHYMAPEQWDPDEFGGITYKADIWALGCVLVHCLTGEPPWEGRNPQQIMRQLFKKNRPDIPKDLPSGLDRCLKLCFAHVPEERPNTAEVCRMLKEIEAQEKAAQEQALLLTCTSM